MNIDSLLEVAIRDLTPHDLCPIPIDDDLPGAEPSLPHVPDPLDVSLLVEFDIDVLWEALVRVPTRRLLVVEQMLFAELLVVLLEH